MTPTPDLTLVFGGLTLNGQPAPAGTRVEALTPRGDVAGCFVVDTPGQYGFMPLYGEDPTAAPPIPGFRQGEAIRLRVNGMAVTATELTWEGDRDAASARPDGGRRMEGMVADGAKVRLLRGACWGWPRRGLLLLPRPINHHPRQ